MSLSPAALARFNLLFKSGVSYRTALALAPDADTFSGGGGGGSGTVTSVNAKSPVAGAVTLVKGDLGLGNVDNTSDVNKPVSTAQAASIGARMSAAANGSDIAVPATFRTNLGLAPMATQNYVEGTLGAQPTAAVFGAGWYFATDQNGGTLYHSNGTAWTQYSPGVAAVAFGQLVAQASITANITTTATAATDAPGLSVTFTAVAGALYWIWFKGLLGNTASGASGFAEITDGANNAFDGAGYVTRSANDSAPMPLQAFKTPGAGSVTYKIRYWASASTAFFLGSATGVTALSVMRVA